MEKRLEEIKNRVKEAIKGPWDYEVIPVDDWQNKIEVVFNADEYAELECNSTTDALNTALFIAKAREDIPFLLEVIEKLQKDKASLETEVDIYIHALDEKDQEIERLKKQLEENERSSERVIETLRRDCARYCEERNEAWSDLRRK
jgi:chromosome segregation ATPase